MRQVLFVALLGTTLSTNPVQAQDAPAVPGRVRSDQHDGSRFENGPPRKRSAEPPRAGGTAPNSGPAVKPATPPRPPASMLPTVQAVPPGPPQKNLTGEEFGLIHIGSTVKEVLAVLGPPSSRLVVPDDDGHLRETFQYWAKGAPLGTVRVDNGRVVKIETKPK